MILFAAFTIYGRIKEKQITFFMPVCLSMMISFFLITFLVTEIVVDVKPWWKPQYFIPIGGMVIGNSMNAIAIALERLLNEMRSKRQEIEMKLCLGADYKEASIDIVRNAMKAGMIPSINSMMAVGIVFIPGMMTGQILAGANPMTAIKYQIVVMIMLVGATTLGTLLVVLIIRKRCFSSGHQLLVTSGS
jgi:putative ABC transport system permease protein